MPIRLYLDHAKNARGKRDLAKMKSEKAVDTSSKLWARMVNVVKAPEKRRTVVGEMPVVEGQIHEQETSGQLKPAWKGEKVDKTEWLCQYGPAQRPLEGRLD